MKINNRIMFFLFFLTINICGCDPGTEGEKIVKDFYFNNDKEIFSLINIIKNDSLFSEINYNSNSFLFNIKGSYSLIIIINEKRKEYDFTEIDAKNIDSAFSKWIRKLIISKDSINYFKNAFKYQKNFENIEYIFKFLKDHSLINISHYGLNIIRIGVKPGVELIYKSEGSSFVLENIEGLIFNNIHNEYYYYYNPRTR